MSETTTVAFRISESVKQEWDEAAESNEQYNSVSHLIRLAVQKELRVKNGSQSDPKTASDPEVLESLNRLETAVEDIQSDLDAIGREAKSDELYSLEQVLLEVLPTYDPDVDPFGADPRTTDMEALLEEIPTAHEIAGRIGADTSDVRDAVKRLAENTSRVNTLHQDESGESVYCWRVE